MKAKEYFEKYEGDIIKEAMSGDAKGDGPSAKMLIEFTKEMKQIIEARHVRIDRGVIHVIREQNQKWNAVANLFEKKYGVSPIKRDGFYKVMQKEIGGLPNINGGTSQ